MVVRKVSRALTAAQIPRAIITMSVQLGARTWKPSMPR
jgi:hypothetical protein